MSLEIKKGSSASVNSFLVKRGELVRQLTVHNSCIDPKFADELTGKLISLQSLTVDGGLTEQNEITDADIRLLKRICAAGSLSKLNLSYLNNISLAVINDFIGSFGLLTNLNLNHCIQVSDSSLSEVAASCRNLRILSLRRTMVSDAGLTDLSKFCSSLRSADFGECTRITDAGVESVAMNNSDLQEINVDFCPGITGTVIVALAKGCQNIEAISMEATPIRKLPAAVVCLSKLKQLKLLGCKELTHPPLEVAQQTSTAAGFQRLMNFFLDCQLSYRIKVFVIGEPGVGKSALIKCLTFDNPLLMPKGSPGFGSVSLWDPTSSVPSDKMPGKYIFEIWELPDDIVGLGDIFYIDPAIYIVTFDLLEPDGIDSVVRNVLSIWSRFPNACLLVVGTHADSLDEDALLIMLSDAEKKINQLLSLRKNVASKFADEVTGSVTSSLPPVCQRQVNILTELTKEVPSFVHAVSCRSRRGITELREVLLQRCAEHARYFPQLSHQLTPALVQLYEDICQMRAQSIIILPWTEFSYFAERAGIPPEDVEKDTRFLHNAGIIFDFRYLSASSAVSSESYICTDPAKFLDLLNSLHIPTTTTSLGENFDSVVAERGKVLGRMLPSLWKLSDTDQLELLEILSRQLGVLCPISSAFPPAEWDKLIPPLPLGANRCAFVRRMYSLPHFYSRLQHLSRPIHWLPELALDECELSICFQIPGEIITILESTFHRLIAAMPSLYFASRGKSELVLSDNDLSSRTVLLRFMIDIRGSQPTEVVVRIGLSDTDGISVSARINKTDLSHTSNDEQPWSYVLWFYCISLARNVYSRLVDQLSGIPMSFCFKSNQSTEPVMLVNLLLAWQANKSGVLSKLLFPSITYPSSCDFEGLSELFDYLSIKLRASIVTFGLEVGSKFPTWPESSAASFVCDGIIVNDGCFRRGKIKKLSVCFADDFPSRPSSAASTRMKQAVNYTSPSLPCRPQNHDSSSQGFLCSMKPETFRYNFMTQNTRLLYHVGSSNPPQPQPQHDSKSNLADEIECDDSSVMNDTFDDLNDYCDELSVLSSPSRNNNFGNLLESPILTEPKTRQLNVSFVAKRKKAYSPPPINVQDHENALMMGELKKETPSQQKLSEENQLQLSQPKICLATEENYSEIRSETTAEFTIEAVSAKASVSVHTVEHLSVTPSSCASLSPSSAESEKVQRPSPTLTDTLKTTKEDVLPSATVNMNKSMLSSPRLLHSAAHSSTGEDSGIVGGYGEEVEEQDIAEEKQNDQNQEAPSSLLVAVGEKREIEATEPLLERNEKEPVCSNVSRTQSSDSEPLSERLKLKFSSLSLPKRHKHKSISHGATNVPNTDKTHVRNVAIIGKGATKFESRKKKDRTKCLCS